MTKNREVIVLPTCLCCISRGPVCRMVYTPIVRQWPVHALDGSHIHAIVFLKFLKRPTKKARRHLEEIGKSLVVK